MDVEADIIHEEDRLARYRVQRDGQAGDEPIEALSRNHLDIIYRQRVESDEPEVEEKREREPEQEQSRCQYACYRGACRQG